MSRVHRRLDGLLASRRGLVLVLVAVVAAGFSAGGSARVAYALLTDTEAAPSTFSTAATFPSSIAFVKVVGTSTCGGSSSAVTVPAAGVAAGNTLILSVVVRGNTTGAASATDTKGNTYTLDATSVRSGQGQTYVLSARVATALVSGDTITVSHPNSNAEGAVVSEFSGIAAVSRVDVTATTNGNSNSPSATVATSGGPRLIVGAVGSHNNRTYTEASGWTTLQHLAQNCGGASNRADNHSGYRIEAASGSFTYNPTSSHSEHWYEAVVAYK